MTTQHALTTDAVTGQRQVLRITELRSHPARMLVVFGAPTAFLVTGLLHAVAAGDHNLYTAVGDQAPLWIGVHTVQLLLILLMAVAIYWLTEGLTGPAAQSSRVALLFYLVFYSAFDSIVGLSNGLVAQVRTRTVGRRAGRAARRERHVVRRWARPTCALHHRVHRQRILAGCRDRRRGGAAPGRSATLGDEPTGPWPVSSVPSTTRCPSGPSRWCCSSPPFYVLSRPRTTR